MAAWCWSCLSFLALISSVTGVTMIIQDTSLMEGQTLQITCQQESLDTDIMYSLRLQRFDTVFQTYETVVRYDLSEGSYQNRWVAGTRESTTESFNTNQTGGLFVYKLKYADCQDASPFRCFVITSAVPELEPTALQNVTVHGVTKYLQVDGPLLCTSNVDPDCQQCRDFDDPFGQTPTYAEMQKPTILTCTGLFATPVTMNKVTWYKRVLNQEQNYTITENITKLESEPPIGNQCTVKATSTLTYYPQPGDRELRIGCEVSNPGGQRADNQTASHEISICVQGLIVGPTTQSRAGTVATTRRPVTFHRDKASVRNITQTSAVLLIDMRDPPSQLVSTGYNLHCEETPEQRLAVNIDIQKKDATWGNGTARFSLVGLSPGQMYHCEASSRTVFGPGWIDNFFFMTIPIEARKSPFNQFTWKHAAGLGSVGILFLLGVFIAQHQSA